VETIEEAGAFLSEDLGELSKNFKVKEMECNLLVVDRKLIERNRCATLLDQKDRAHILLMIAS